MPSNKNKLNNIPTSLVTGFLGVGKTSAILHLMSQKPANEKWSVLVNEFGSIGIDGAIYKAKGIEVKEIPGGCMCCAAGAPLQVAVNRILSATKPQRLLIEPSGLGHPKRVLDTLQGQYFKQVLSLKATICLIDPRNLDDERYTTHENFIDQIALADILVANKSDLCDSNTMARFYDFAKALHPAKQKIIETQFGRLDAALLDYQAGAKRNAQFPDFHQINKTKTVKANRDGYQTHGWKFSQEAIFDFDKLLRFFDQFKQTRIKAILKTSKGWMVFNIQDKQQDIYAVDRIDSGMENKLEIISRDEQQLNKQALDSQLKQCLSKTEDTSCE